MSKKVLLEDIVSFQSIEDFEEATDAVYEDLSDSDLIKELEKWHCPGNHDENWYNYNELNTPFLGNRVNENYVLARHEEGFIIGLSFIKRIKY